MRRNLVAMLVLAVVAMGAVPAAAQAVKTEAEYSALRWPTATMRLTLPAKLAKLDALAHLKVDTITALKAVPATDRTDGMLCIVKAGADGKPHGYMFHGTSTATNDNDLVVAGNTGGGRWLRLDQASADGIPAIEDPVAGGLALMTADGELATSLYSPDSFASAAQGTKADSALPQEVLAATDDDSNDSITANARQVLLTTKSLTTAATTNYTLTWVTSHATATSPVICGLSGGTAAAATSGDVGVLYAVAAQGQVTVVVRNYGESAALDGTVVLSCAVF